MSEIERTVEHPLSSSEEAWDLFAYSARMPPVSILQFLELGRQSGQVVVEAPGAPMGYCTLVEGKILEASLGHLRGPDALLAMLEAREGSIAFRALEVHTDDVAALRAVSPLIMESVRLEDEFERVAPDFPGDHVRLELRDRNEVPVDPLHCGIDTVMIALLARPGSTVRQLEQMLALAPSKVRLAVAWLGSTNRLLARQTTGFSSASLAAIRPTEDWYVRLLQVRPGGLRIVFGFGPRLRDHQLISAVRGLAKGIGAAPAWISIAPDGSAVARVRPRAGGLLSLACLPTATQHTATFASFVRSADLVLVCADAPADVVGEWKHHVAIHVPMLRLDCEALTTSLVRALKQHAAALWAMRTEEEQWGTPESGGRPS